MANDNERLELEVGIDQDTLKKELALFEAHLISSGESAGEKASKALTKGLTSSTGSDAVNAISTSMIAKGVAIGNVLGEGIKKGVELAIHGLEHVFDEVKKGVDLSAASDAGVRSLSASLYSIGQNSREAVSSLVQFAEEVQNTTKYSSDATIQASALIAAIGKLSGESLKNATSAATDLASAFNIDLLTAARAIGKAAEGNIDALSRMGFTIKKGSTDAETYANAMKAVSRLQGFAEKDTGTYSGAVTRLNNAFEDLIKQVGHYITRSPVVIEAINLISSGIIKLVHYIEAGSKSFDVLGRTLIESIKPASIALGVLVGLLEIVWNTVKSIGNLAATVFYSLAAGVNYVVESLTNASVAFLNFVTGTKAALPGFAMTSAALDGVKESFDSMNQAGMAAMTAQTPIADSIVQTASITKDSLQEMFSGYLDYMKNVSNEVGSAINKEEIKISLEDIAREMGNTANKIQTTAASIARSLNTTLVNGFSNAFAGVGAALVKGQNALDAFAGGVLATFGDVLIQLGTATLAAGLGMSTATVLFGAQGPAAVAAGIAMIVAGGALKTFGAGIGGGSAIGGGATAGGGGGAGGGDLSAPQGDQFAMSQEDVRAKKGTEVNVIVQGNVLDRRETGLEIVQILRESFDQEGTVLVTG